MPEAVIKIFYSYSRKDLGLRNKLEAHLAPLKRANRIQTWHDLELEPGTEWERDIQAQLNTADIILLLVSSDFMASDYCYSTELERAIARHNAGKARVIPVILRPCDWNQPYVPFSKLNVLPTHANPVTSWLDMDEAFAIVAQRIRETVEQLRTQRLAAQQAAEQQLLAQKEAEQQAERERLQREQQEAEEQERQRQALRLQQQAAAEAEQQKQQELERQRVQQQVEDAQRRQVAQPVSDDDLASDRGVDYTHLRDLLKAGKWKAADQETTKCMCEVMGCQRKPWLRTKDIRAFPCNDLRTIDQLWVTYSKGRFGFSVQKQIWVEVGENYSKFGDQVGWRISKTVIRASGILWMKREEEKEEKQWLPYGQLNFSLEAPEGHLPIGSGVRLGSWWWLFFSHIKNCRV